MISKAIVLLVNTGVFYSLSKFLPGFRIKNEKTAFVIAVLFSIVSFFVNLFSIPLLGFFTVLLMPLTVIPILGKIISGAILQLTIFIITLLISTISLKIVDMLVEEFEIDSIKTAIIAAIIIAFSNAVLSLIL